MIPQPPPGQGPVDPRGAFSSPPPPGGAAPGPPMPPGGFMPPMMPMMMPPFYPPPPRGRSFAGAIFTTLATTILGLSILLNVILLFSSTSEHEGTKQEVLVDGDSSQQVAVIPIHGVIDESMVEHFTKTLKEVEKNSSVKALVLDIDSPGGGVTASDEIYDKLVKLREQKHIPVVAAIGELGASGAFYISCATDYVFAEKTSLTGSIGVIMPSYNIHELTDKYGIKETTIVADGATYKNAGSPMQPVNERDQAYFQALIDHAFDRFKEVVKTGRKLKTNIDEVAVGKIFSSKEALDLGLIDQIDYAEAAWDKAAQLAGLKNKEVVKYTPSQGIFDMLTTDTKFTRTPPQSSVTINGINLNVDRNALSDLLTPRPMYLWRGQ